MNNPLGSSDFATTVLTVNHRLARSLRLVFDAERLTEGLSSWETPNIFPLSVWVQQSWEEYTNRSKTRSPILLSTVQERVLWERIIQETESQNGIELLQVSKAAQQAMVAWAQSKGWRITEQDYRNPWDADSKMFSRWADAFVHLCQKYAWIDPASALDQLILMVRAKEIKLPKRVTFAGFDEFTPQQKDLLKALEHAGVALQTPKIPTLPSRIPAVRTSMIDEEKELESAARWARALLERGSKGPIGIVIPELTRMRSTVLRIFHQTLHPEVKPFGALTVSPWFNISLGEPLTKLPLIRDAVLALSLLNRQQQPITKLSQFLLSPYFAGADSEYMARTRIDASLRARGVSWLTLSALSRYSEAIKPSCDPKSNVPILRTRLAKLRKLPKRQTLTYWARIFADSLGHLGWPGERTLNSSEYQAVTAFHELLGEIAGLNIILSKSSFSEALSRLQQMADERIFQPRSNLAPVQILGVREAAGLRFSHLWILGLHAGAWPPPAKPNPFLPVALQRRVGMPHASPKVELAQAQWTTRRMLANADEIIVSYPQTRDDLPETPSPLITMLPEVNGADLLQNQALKSAWYLSSGSSPHGKLWFSDEQGPTIDSEEPIFGGTRIWQDQAACPFRAFAIHRLGAVTLATPSIMLDYSMRGTMVHRALELIWGELRDSTRLNTLTENQLQTQVTEAIDQTLSEVTNQRPETFQTRLVQLERERLISLTMEWLALEKKRPPFTVIAPEQGKVVSLSKLPVSIRPDRIDRIEDDQYLILDYKTGNNTMNGWFGERPTNPQLPLYAILEKSTGIGFAFVRRGEIRFEGIAASPGIAPGIETIDKTRTKAAKAFSDWNDLCEKWHSTLASLATSFAQGDAKVDPKSSVDSCRYCDLHPFCRIWEYGS